MRHYAQSLLQMLACGEYQALYLASEGVCLPHLRLMLAGDGRVEGLHYCLEESARRMAELERDLREIHASRAIRTVLSRSARVSAPPWRGRWPFLEGWRQQRRWV